VAFIDHLQPLNHLRLTVDGKPCAIEFATRRSRATPCRRWARTAARECNDGAPLADPAGLDAGAAGRQARADSCTLTASDIVFPSVSSISSSDAFTASTGWKVTCTWTAFTTSC
jgi:hypothetical protein